MWQWIYDIPVIEIFNKLKFIDQGITAIILFEYEIILENSNKILQKHKLLDLYNGFISKSQPLTSPFTLCK